MTPGKSLTALAARFRFIRFAMVGLGVTILDFAVLNALIALFGGEDPGKKTVLLCNTLSASVAATVSFFFNKHFVFQSKHTPNHFMVRFLIITLSGLYILQNLVVVGSLELLEHPVGTYVADVTKELSGISVTAHFIAINGAKLLGTACTIAWNYSLYKVFVFKPLTEKPGDETGSATP
jgi:putative flippase GtrA